MKFDIPTDDIVFAIFFRDYEFWKLHEPKNNSMTPKIIFRIEITTQRANGTAANANKHRISIIVIFFKLINPTFLFKTVCAATEVVDCQTNSVISVLVSDIENRTGLFISYLE